MKFNISLVDISIWLVRWLQVLMTAGRFAFIICI
jgi:hypothetical protein